MRTTGTRTIYPQAILPRRLTWTVVVVMACSLFYGAYWWPDGRSSGATDRVNVNGSIAPASSLATPTVSDTTPGQPGSVAVRVPATQSSIVVTAPDGYAEGQSVMNSLAAASTDEYRTDIYEKELASGDSLAYAIMQTHGLSAERPSAGQPRTQTHCDGTTEWHDHGSRDGSVRDRGRR
jgi:hypothetical protein